MGDPGNAAVAMLHAWRYAVCLLAATAVFSLRVCVTHTRGQERFITFIWAEKVSPD